MFLLFCFVLLFICVVFGDFCVWSLGFFLLLASPCSALQAHCKVSGGITYSLQSVICIPFALGVTLAWKSEPLLQFFQLSLSPCDLFVQIFWQVYEYARLYPFLGHTYTFCYLKTWVKLNRIILFFSNLSVFTDVGKHQQTKHTYNIKKLQYLLSLSSCSQISM